MIFAVAITGPTASGKTALSLSLAKALDGEIISCDSMQIYKGMDIGTAKATSAEREEVAHHLIDIVSPLDNFSVESYREMATKCCYDLDGRGKTPVFVGGTGLYIDSLTRGSAMSVPESDAEYRDKILDGLKTDEDIDALWQRLYEVDAESAEKIHKNNVKRVIRALEIYDKTGRKKSDLDRESQDFTPEVFVGMITLDFLDRELLYRRIDTRVDMMVDMGLVTEVESLYRSGLLSGKTASAAIGYKEIVEFLEDKCTLPEAIEKIKLASRRYAKRQLTWFRHKEGIKVIFADNPDGTMKDSATILDEAIAIVGELRYEYEIKKGEIKNEG